MEADAAPFCSYDLKTVLSFLVTFLLRVTSSSSRGPSEERERELLGRHSASHRQLQTEVPRPGLPQGPLGRPLAWEALHLASESLRGPRLTHLPLAAVCSFVKW